MHKKNKKAFTILELMVVIAIIMILLTWLRSLNFNKMSNQQESEIFANKIISLIEEMRDNTITWKWVPVWNWVFNVTNERTIEITAWENFIVEAKYLKQDNTTYETIQKIQKQKIEKIDKVVCVSGSTPNLTENNFSWKIVFKWDKINLELSPNNNCFWKLRISANYNNEINVIELDPISWLVKKCKNSCQ